MRMRMVTAGAAGLPATEAPEPEAPAPAPFHSTSAISIRTSSSARYTDP